MKGTRKFITLGVLIALVLTVGIITFTNVPLDKHLAAY